VQFIVSKAVAAPAGGKFHLPGASPTSAGTSSKSGGGSRGGKILGQRPGGAQVYETEMKDRTGKGAASGNIGNTHKEVEKRKKSSDTDTGTSDQNQMLVVGGNQQGQQNSQGSNPLEGLDKYHHTGITRGNHNRTKQLVDHNGAIHTIMGSSKDSKGVRHYIVHSGDGSMSKIDAEHLHSYVENMDNAVKKKTVHKEREKGRKMAHQEHLFARSLFYIKTDMLKSSSPISNQSKNVEPGMFVTGGMWGSPGTTLDKKDKEKIQGGLASGKSPDDFDQNQLREGTKVEKEHTPSEEVAKEIAMDHLTEHSRYYDALNKMEEGMQRTQKSIKFVVVL